MEVHVPYLTEELVNFFPHFITCKIGFALFTCAARLEPSIPKLSDCTILFTSPVLLFFFNYDINCTKSLTKETRERERTLLLYK